MDFKHTEERQMLTDMIQRYVLNEYPLGARNDAAHGPQGFDLAHWNAFAELGLIGAFFDEASGGFGGSGFDVACVFEALGQGCVIEPLADCALVPGNILAATADMDRLATVIAGETRLAVAFDEYGSRFDRTRCATTATRTADGWALNGTKAMIKFAGQSDALIVSARTGAETGQFSLFLVPLDVAGLTSTAHALFDGGQAMDIKLSNVELPIDALIGPEHGGGALVETATAWGLLAVCSEALGLMEAVKAITLEYMRTRKQFGTEIGRFQALQHRMAQMLLEIEQARSAVINAAASMDLPHPARRRALSAAKFTIGRIGTLVCEETIQLHGGIGMTWEYDVGHLAKRLMMIDHEMGDTDYHLSQFMRLPAA